MLQTDEKLGILHNRVPVLVAFWTLPDALPFILEYDVISRQIFSMLSSHSKPTRVIGECLLLSKSKFTSRTCGVRTSQTLCKKSHTSWHTAHEAGFGVEDLGATSEYFRPCMKITGSYLIHAVQGWQFNDTGKGAMIKSLACKWFRRHDQNNHLGATIKTIIQAPRSEQSDVWQSMRRYQPSAVQCWGFQVHNLILDGWGSKPKVSTTNYKEYRWHRARWSILPARQCQGRYAILWVISGIPQPESVFYGGKKDLWK